MTTGNVVNFKWSVLVITAVEPRYNIPGGNGFSVITFDSAGPVRSLIETVVYFFCLLRLCSTASQYTTLHLHHFWCKWLQDEITGVITAVVQWVHNAPVLWQWSFTSKCLGPLQLTWTAATANIMAPSMCVLKIAATRCHVLALAISPRDSIDWPQVSSLRLPAAITALCQTM